MAVRTLETLRTLFYAKTGLDEANVPVEGALEFINLGFELLSQDTGGLTTLIKTDTVVDQEDYVLPDYVLKVDEVHVYDSGGRLTRILEKTEPRYLQRKSGAVQSGNPEQFSFSPSQKKDGDRGRPTLRVLPAFSAVITDGLWVYARRLPDRKADFANNPDMGDGAAQMAAVSAACWYATGDPNRKAMLWREYELLKASYNRSRGSRMPVYAYRGGFNPGN